MLQIPWRAALVGLLFLMVPAVAGAQSAISGVVRDTSGAILPGVTVEASSPALIEQVRAVVTDGEGRFSIVDLRPGPYVVVFTLPGFSTLRRDGIDLPSNFNMTINGELRVGSLEESITVTGDAPVVDVQSVQRTQVLSRDMLDALPSARSYSSLAALLPGVKQSNTDVGGNQQMEQIYMTVHGSRQTDTTVQIDGMQVNSLMSNGQVQAYFSDAANAEMTYQTSAVGAEVSGGGVRINMIPKEGGNQVSGSVYAGGSSGSWQSDNVTDELRARGLQSGDRVDHITDVNYGIGGPIVKDRLWYFHSLRRISTNEVVANNFYSDGRPGVEDQWIYNALARLTWQVDSKNKLSAHYDRYPKFKGHEMGALTDPETAAGRRDWTHANYYTASAKFTSTVSNRILFEAGYSNNMETLLIGYQPGIQQERFSPDWYTTIAHQELVGAGTTTEFALWGAKTTPATRIDPKKYVLSSSLSYITGSHSIKTGIQWGFGSYVLEYDINGDLRQRYRNGVADSVVIYNTPIRSKEALNADLGVYIQDAWTINQLTVNAGVRLETFRGEIGTQDISAGRFVPAREFNQQKCMPCWSDIAPRFGVAYDVFGDARTAIKASVNRYMAGQTTGYAARYNPLALQSDIRTWSDLNGDDVAQESEIGRSNNLGFGLPRSTIRPVDRDREYDWEYTAGIQHEVTRGLAFSASFYHRDVYNQLLTTNTLLSLDDYTAIDVVNPLNGEVFTAYNLHPAKQGLVDQIDVNSPDRDKRRQTYNGVELGLNGRLHNATFFGGWTFDRTTAVTCDSTDNPNSFRFCDESALDMPLRHEFKVAGSYLFPYDLQVNLGLQSYAGAELATNWSIGRSTRYAAGCLGPCTPGALVIPGLTPSSLTVALAAPGSQYYDRQTQVDLGIRKLFTTGRFRYSGQLDVFNLTNSSYVKSQTTTFGPSLGLPLSILQPRTLRLAVQLRF